MSTAHPIRPFYFSPLNTTFQSGNFETLDLISKLFPPPLPKRPTPTTTSGEKMVEDTLEWVAKPIVDKGATYAWKVMEKEIQDSDASKQQNRFLIKKHSIDGRIMPAMTKEELVSANLISIVASNRSQVLHGREGEAGERKQGREYGGLDVMVYNRDGWCCSLYLTRWDATKASVIKGGKYNEFLRRSQLAVGDQVEMWAFRNGDGKLCFVIENKVDLGISL